MEPSENRCHACSRPLTDPVSLETGVGPSCAAMAAQRGPLPLMFQAEYFVEEFRGVLIIFDRGSGSISVAADIERILAAERQTRGPLPRLVIFRDPSGNYARARHRNGVFGGFVSLRSAQSLTDALTALKEARAA